MAFIYGYYSYVDERIVYVGQTQITALNKGIVRKQAKVEYPIRKTKFMR